MNVRRGFICNRVKETETKSSETVSAEIKIPNQIWLCVSAYSSPSLRIHTLLEGLVNYLSKACIKYDKYIIMGDFNIVAKKKNQLEEFCTPCPSAIVRCDRMVSVDNFAEIEESMGWTDIYVGLVL